MKLPSESLIEVRRMELYDCDDINSLCSKLDQPNDIDEIKSKLEDMLLDNSMALYVAEVNDRVVAFIQVSVSKSLVQKSSAIVNALIISEEYRVSKIETLLMQKAEGWAEGKELAHVFLRTQTKRKENHKQLY